MCNGAVKMLAKKRSGFSSPPSTACLVTYCFIAIALKNV